MGRTSDKRELNGGSSWLFSDWLASRREINNGEPVDVGEATSGVPVGGSLVDCKGEVGVLSGDAVFEGILGERKVTTELVSRYKPEGVRGRESSFGSEKNERQSSQGGTIEYSAA